MWTIRNYQTWRRWFLVKNNDIKQFAKYIKTLMKDDTLRIQMGAKAKQNVKRFQVETIMKQWIKLFKELVN